jgi:hypothetical protein
MRTAGAFAFAALLRLPKQNPAGTRRFAVGCGGIATGWKISYSTLFGTLEVQLGPATLFASPAMCGEDHMLVLAGFDPAQGSGFVVTNNELGAAAAPIAYVPELAVEFSMGDEVGALAGWHDGGIAAFGFTDTLVTFEQAFELWAETERAGDILDTAGMFQYLWSARDGMANVVDNGNEVWTDIRSGVQVPRVGVQVGMAAGARDAEWSKLSEYGP